MSDIDLTDEQIDNLVSEADQPLNRTMPENESELPDNGPQDQGIVFTANGKEVKVDNIDQLKKYASQGYNYAQLMNEYKTQKDQFQQKYSQYESIDKYAAENPDWWNHVNNSFQGVQNGVQEKTGQETRQEVKIGEDGKPVENDDDELMNHPVVQKLIDENKQIKTFIDEFNSQKQAEIRRQEDEAFKQEMQSIRDAYSDLDWNTPNHEGKSLEYQVLEHANKIGVDSFKTAFRDFYHEKLIERAELKGKEKVSKEIQLNRKLGLLGESPTPFKQLEQELSPSEMSYDQIEKAALAELGIAN